MERLGRLETESVSKLGKGERTGQRLHVGKMQGEAFR